MVLQYVTSMPETAPKIAPLKLVTMTIRVNLNSYLNLGVIAETIKLSDTIRSISYKNIKRVYGSSEQITRSDQSERFKNQCTLDINIGDKIVNTKIFNNGKVINVGCLAVEHATKAVQIIIDHIWNNSHQMVYQLYSITDFSNPRKFFKDEIRKKYGSLIQLLIMELGMDTDMGMFDPFLTSEQAFPLFLDNVKDIMYVYTIISVLKNYYDETTMLTSFSSLPLQRLLASLELKDSKISADLPVHIHGPALYPGVDDLHIELINKSTNSGYYINRNALQELLLSCPEINSVEYDKNRYPGVIVEHLHDNKITKVIFFNTGKINITAAHTHEQIDEVYSFIERICCVHFDDLLLKSEYQNKIKEYEDSLPDKFEIGDIEGQQYFLIKKLCVLSNPRNLKLLKKIGVLDKYKI
jgi:TATA-box binding protein (TBP) (component of TFIID and TFIIIB)